MLSSTDIEIEAASKLLDLDQTLSKFSSSEDWAKDFVAKHGRAARVLHVSNIANNAYLNAHILNEVGIENHVIANDLYHFGSCPEWFDSGGVKLDRAQIGEDFFPDFWRAGVPDSARPRWFSQAPQFLALEYLCLFCDDNPLKDLAWAAMQYERFKTTICKDTMPERLTLDDGAFYTAAKKSRLDGATLAMFEEVRSYQPVLDRMFACFAKIYGPNIRTLLSVPFTFGYADAFEPLVDDKEAFVIWRDLRSKGILAALGYEMADLGTWKRPIVPRGVRQEDADVFIGAQGYWERLYSRYDYVINYATSPYLGLLNRRKFLAYEHGTIRSIPFDDNVIGRLTGAGYQYAGGVFITNIDYITAEQKLTLDRAKIHYIPHAFDETPLVTFLNDNAHLKPPADCVKFFWPTRQDWTSRDIRMAKQNDIAIQALALVAKRTDKPFKMVAVDWGVDAEASKDLTRELGIADQFEWIGPVSKQELWQRYMTSHAVVDHFIGESVNGTQCEAMMLSRPVICSDCNTCGTEAYGAPPPYLAGTTVEEVAEQFLKVINDPTDQAGSGKAGFEWMMQHHSKAVITGLLVKALETTPNGVNVPSFLETLDNKARALPRLAKSKAKQMATAILARVKSQAILANWHIKNQVALASWRVKNAGAQAKFRAGNAAWHMKNQAHVAGWHAKSLTVQAKGQIEAAAWQVKNQAAIAEWRAKGAAAKAKNQLDLAAWHVNNQAHVAGWHAKSLTAQAKGQVDAAAWQVKNQAAIAEWRAKGAVAAAKGQLDMAAWHVNNQAHVAGWHAASLTAQAKGQVDAAAWHVKNQAHVAGWHAKNAATQAKGQLDLAAWHVKNQASIAQWRAAGAAFEAKGHLDLAAWHVKNQTSIAEWRAKNFAATAANSADRAAWHIRNQVAIAEWRAQNFTTQAQAQAGLAAWHVKNQMGLAQWHGRNLALSAQSSFGAAASQVVNSQNVAAWHMRNTNAQLMAELQYAEFLSRQFAAQQMNGAMEDARLAHLDEADDWDLGIPSYYFDVEQPPQPDSDEVVVEEIRWGELFSAVFSFGFAQYIAKALYRKLMRQIGVYPKGTVLWFGEEAENLVAAREIMGPDEDWRQGLIAGKSVVLNLFDDLAQSDFDVRGRLGALVPGGAYVVYWHDPSQTWFAIGPNGDMVKDDGAFVTAAARAIGPSGPGNATINIWGVVFRFGPDGSVRHNGDTVGWLGASEPIELIDENLLEVAI
jgi:glycosyltransferase involved in cell wall biosynthesis